MKSSVFQTISHCFVFPFFFIKKLLYYTANSDIPDTTNFFHGLFYCSIQLYLFIIMLYISPSSILITYGTDMISSTDQLAHNLIKKTGKIIIHYNFQILFLQLMNKRRYAAKIFRIYFFSFQPYQNYRSCMLFTMQQKLQFVPFCRWPISVLSDLKSRQSIRMHMQAIPLLLPLPRAHTPRCRSVPHVSRRIPCLLPAHEPSNHHVSVTRTWARENLIQVNA